jgi:hypothetical protein
MLVATAVEWQTFPLSSNILTPRNSAESAPSFFNTFNMTEVNVLPACLREEGKLAPDLVDLPSLHKVCVSFALNLPSK